MTSTALELSVARFTCALPASEVKEVLRPAGVTPVPRAPSFVHGVLNVRGALVPVIDLRERLGLEAGPLRRSSRFVLVALRDRVAALIVDGVRGLVELTSDGAVDAETELGVPHRFVESVVTGSTYPVILLRLGELLSVNELAEWNGDWIDG